MVRGNYPQLRSWTDGAHYFDVTCASAGAERASLGWTKGANRKRVHLERSPSKKTARRQTQARERERDKEIQSIH